MPKHGIIRHNTDLKLKRHNPGECSFTLDYSAKTLKQYPFRFSFKINYKLEQHKLVMTYNIVNKDKVDMFFACGGHTAYACGFNDQIKLTDYVIEFPHAVNLKAMTLGDSGLLSDSIRDIITERNLLQLSENLFDDDALIFANVDYDWVRLRKRSAEKGVVVKFKGFPNLAFWSKPGADYVCIEPWLGLPDRENESIDITEKSTFTRLKPKDRVSLAIETVIE
jgi:galactose mutarotase-like enzyme